MPREDFSTTEAILLRKFPYQEAGAIFSLFTQHYGIIDFIDKGVFSPKNQRTASALEAANLVEVQFFFKQGRSLQVPKRVRLIDDFRNIKEDYDKLCLIAELFKELRKIMPKEDPHQDIFIQLKAFLKLFNEIDNDLANTSVLKFEIYLLEELGFLPSFEKCSMCNLPKTNMYFLKKNNRVVCRDCSAPGPNTIVLIDKSLPYLRNITEYLHLCDSLDIEVIQTFNELIDHIHSGLK